MTFILLTVVDMLAVPNGARPHGVEGLDTTPTARRSNKSPQLKALKGGFYRSRIPFACLVGRNVSAVCHAYVFGITVDLLGGIKAPNPSAPPCVPKSLGFINR
jgi:hypothetical protein